MTEKTLPPSATSDADKDPHVLLGRIVDAATDLAHLVTAKAKQGDSLAVECKNCHETTVVKLPPGAECALSETRPIYSVEQLESWQQSFESLRREFHRQGNHDGQRGCEFALEAIRLYQAGTPVSAIRESEPDEDGERYRWFRNECSWARRSDIVDVAAEEPDLLDHHIDKGRCGL